MTERVRLRPPTRADLPFIRGLWADVATMEAVGGIVTLSADAAEAWFRRMVDPGAPTLKRPDAGLVTSRSVVPL